MFEWLRRWFRGIPPTAYPPMAYVPNPPHPLNVPGDFYVEDGCCIACGVWELEAPDLLAWSPDDFPHCYVARQPETDAEFERMKRAMKVVDVDCIRVRACKPDWLARLREDGLEGQIDPEADYGRDEQGL